MHQRKSFIARAALILLAAGLLASLTLNRTAAATQSLTFTPSADAYVDSSSPATNYGTGTTLRVDSSPTVNSYLRFTVSGLGSQPVTQAQLKIYANSASSQGLTGKTVANNTWGETTLVYNNAPAMGSALSTSAAVASGTWITLDVTSSVTGDGTFNFGVSTPGSTAISLASRESGAHAPQLIVTVNTAPTPTATQPAATNTPSATQPAATNTPQPGGQTVTMIPSADAYVDASSASSNYGTGTTLRADSSPIVNSYLRFNVSGLSGQPITQAFLKIHANSASTQGLVAKSVTNTTWVETTITSSNAPTMGSVLAASAAVTSGSWVSLDVTAYVTSEGLYSFGVSTPGSTAISLSSRESGANSPQLVLTLNGSSTPAPTTVPTNTAVPPTATAPANTPIPPTATVIGATPTQTSIPPTKTPIPPTPTSGGPTPTQPATCSAVVLTKGPTLILTGNNTQMRVFWQWTANSAFTVQWGTSTSYGSSASVAAKDTTNHLYQYDISGLTPSTKYYYRVVTGSQCASGTFYAAPAASATSVKFFSYGDTRSNGSQHNGLAGQVNSAFTADPAFQTLNLNVGDWVSGDFESAWTGEWFNPSYTNIRKQDANIADIGVRGNHESGATYWKRYWPEPFQSGGLYWSFDYGPMHVVMLDQYTSYSAGSAQYNWLKADLAASTKTWKFVVFHEPGWSAGGGHANNTSVQNDLQPLFVQYGVSIAFSGHNHYYARASVGGVTHLTLGGGGAPSYTPASGQPNIVKTYQGLSFGEFTINGNTLTAQVVNNSGSVVDSFTITK